ncbi:MAG: sigma-70 factor domain-containing protein, partial [Janthinobacterium sp.]
MTHAPHDQLDDDPELPEDGADEVVTDDVGELDGIDAVEAGEGGEVASVSVLVESVDELKKVLAAELSTDTTQHYLNQIGTRPLLTAAQEVHYATLAKQGNFEARQTMIEHNLRLVVSIA